MSDRALFGFGLNGFWTTPQFYFGFLHEHDWVLDNYHSGYVAILTETGIVGMTLFALCALLFGFRMSWLRANRLIAPADYDLIVGYANLMFLINFSETLFLRSTDFSEALLVAFFIASAVRAVAKAATAAAAFAVDAKAAIRMRIISLAAKTAMLCLVMVFACALPLASPCAAQDKAAAVARQMAGGVNILGYDGIWDGGIDAPFKQRYFRMICDAGFHHVRINLSAFKYMDSRNDLDLRILARSIGCWNKPLPTVLFPVIDEHDYDQCQRNPDDRGVKLLAFGRNSHHHYAGRFPTAVFELLNEPGGKVTAAWWNAFIQSALRVIRANNPERTVIVAAINSEDPLEIRKLELPPQYRNIIVTVHYYKPMQFTHQGAPWSWRFALLRGIDWGSEDDKSRVRSAI